MTVASLDDVHVSYGDTPALRGLTLSIPRDYGVTGFLGRNGAGKTTTIRAMLGLVAPSSGDVRLFGRSPVGDPSVREAASVMFAENGLLSELSVRENLAVWAGIWGMPSPRVAAVLDDLGIADLAGKRFRDLSSGNRRIAALARALLPRSDFLILDEPTSSLDPARAIEVRSMISELRADRNILISTHNLPEAEELCDHVFIIHEGRVVATGSPSELSAQAGCCIVRIEGARDRLSFRGEDYTTDREGLLRLPLRPSEKPSQLLAELVTEGHAVEEFRAARRSLAEVFISVTEPRAEATE
jgi:ABC-2 type transport system ATP-binding protein